MGHKFIAMLKKLSETSRKDPMIILEKLEEHFTPQHNIIGESFLSKSRKRRTG